MDPASADEPRAHTDRETFALREVRVTWAAALFGLLVGVTMTYLPWEFGAGVFRFIYPEIQRLGSAFLVGGALLAASALYPGWPAVVGWIGRAIFLGAVGIFWWNVAILAGGLTGVVVYPLLAAGLLAESTRAFRHRGAFAMMIAAIGVLFGAMMLLRPDAFSSTLYAAWQPFPRGAGALHLVSGVALGWALGRDRRRVARAAAVALALLFGYASFGSLESRAWTGMVLYGVLMMGAGVGALARSLPAASSIRFRLLRAVALAGVIPLLTLGAVASIIAQRAVQAQVRVNAEQATLAEVSWLADRLSAVSAAVRLTAREEMVARWLAQRATAPLESRLNRVEHDSRPLDGVWVLDLAGERVAASSGVQAARGHNFAHREYFQRALAEPGVFVSRPLVGATGKPFVVVSTRIVENGVTVGVLAGGLSLEHLNREVTLASQRYDVRVVDVRDGTLVRATGTGALLEQAGLEPRELEGPHSFEERFDAAGNLVLMSHAQVAGTPWRVVLAQPLRDAYAPLARLSLAVLGMAVVAALLAVLLAHLGAREIVGRLGQLRSAFAGVVQMDPEGAPRSPDELSALEAAFSGMAADIEHTHSELRAAVATRESFLSIASHELRTPITALRTTLEILLKRGEGGGYNAQALLRMRRQLDRLTRLVADLLDVSRLRTGNFALAPAPTDGLALVKEVVDRIRAEPAQGARLEVDLPEEPISGVWDDQRIEQVLTNLIENAFRYSYDGTPVRLVVRSSPTHVRVSVIDQGIGIPAESVGSLFRPFFRAGNASSKHAGGLGLGLAICREIVERHGGRIWVESDGPGQGSRFHVELPLAPPERGQSQTA